MFEGLPSGSSTVAFYVLMALVTWVSLRMEGVSIAELGSRPGYLLVGAVTVASLIVLANLVGLMIASLTGTPTGLDHLWGERNAGDWIRSIAIQFLFVGMIEELGFRGYLQNWFLRRFGTQRWWGVTGAILVSGLLFSLWHPAPSEYLSGAWLDQLPMLGLLWFSGIGFGIIYYFSGNLYLAAGLHGLGNTWPFAFVMGDWSPLALGIFWTFVAGLYLAAILVCRTLGDFDRQAPR